MDNCVFYFETDRIDADNRYSYYFSEPLFVLSLEDPGDLISFFSDIERLRHSYYLAGFLSYELGLLFESRFFSSLSLLDIDFPYALFGVYERVSIYDNVEGRFIEGSGCFGDSVDLAYSVSNLRRNVSRGEYVESVARIKDSIYRGDLYQANYTIKYHFDFAGSPFGLYNFLRSRQSVSYNVFASFMDYSIISISPELFFSLDGDRIRMKPMKGTMRRGLSLSEDEEFGYRLLNDVKNRSENVMIVDLLRNDLGIISKWSSVVVTRLFELERYNSLYQMTSTIESRLRGGLSFYDIVRALFPSGSITGAPKIASMGFIDTLERERRRVYTGAIGFLCPSSRISFNVAIRTLLLRGICGEFGVGGGIVYDSDALGEEEECLLKASFFMGGVLPLFSLVETLKFSGGDYEDLDLHLSRLRSSVIHFSFVYDDVVLRDLLSINRFLYSSMGVLEYKVRILLDRGGGIEIVFTRIESLFSEYRLCISDSSTDSGDIFLYHKTTNRAMYEKEFAFARSGGYFDVIFFNERGELTEGSISNIYLEFSSSLYTPSLSCGLLAGIIRSKLLLDGKVEERVLSRDDLLLADRVYISNSLVGFIEVIVVV